MHIGVQYLMGYAAGGISQLRGCPALSCTDFPRCTSLRNAIATRPARAGAQAVLQAIDERRSAGVLAMA
jgi:hypothetical protein